MESVQEKEAVALTPELQQAYAKLIKALFNGVISAEPDQVNERVVKDVDAMITAIADCSKGLKELSYRLIYEATIGTVVGKSVGHIVRFFLAKQSITDEIENYVVNWLQELSSKVQSKACVNAARVSWKSVIEIDLLDV